MKATEQTIQQIERAIRRVAQKFPVSDDAGCPATDLHVRVSQDSGELLVFDDDENEIIRCIVEQWIGNTNEHFYRSAAETLRNVLRHNHAIIDGIGLMKPFSVILEDDEKEKVAELYMADDCEMAVGDGLMMGLDKDLDSFLDDLLKKD